MKDSLFASQLWPLSTSLNCGFYELCCVYYRGILFHFRYVKPPIFTLCVGNAWGEAALLLAAGAKGNRSALPSSTIMIKQVFLVTGECFKILLFHNVFAFYVSLLV